LDREGVVAALPPSGVEVPGARVPSACAPRLRDGEGEIGKLEWISPLARRAFGVAELGKKSGSEDGVPPPPRSSLLGVPLLLRAFRTALPCKLLPPVPLRVAESGAKSGLALFALLPPCGVAVCEPGVPRWGDEDGKARGDEECGA